MKECLHVHTLLQPTQMLQCCKQKNKERKMKRLLFLVEVLKRASLKLTSIIIERHRLFMLEAPGTTARTTVRNLLFCVHALCMNYITNTFLLVSSSVTAKQLLRFVHGRGQKSEHKNTTGNLSGFITIPLYYYDIIVIVLCA